MGMCGYVCIVMSMHVYKYVWGPNDNVGWLLPLRYGPCCFWRQGLFTGLILQELGWRAYLSPQCWITRVRQHTRLVL